MQGNVGVWNPHSAVRVYIVPTGMSSKNRHVWLAPITLGFVVAVRAVIGTELSWIAHDESIVVLESPQFHFDWDHRRVPLEIDLFHCATDPLHSKYPQIRLITQTDFVKRAFPNLDPQEAPISPESLKLLSGNETLRARIASLNVRYVVYGATENDIETVYEGFGCAGAPGPPAVPLCFGGGQWNKRSTYNLLIMDLKQLRQFRRSGAAAGTSWFAMLVPLFAGWRSATEAQTCVRLGADVLAQLEQSTIAAASEEARTR